MKKVFFLVIIGCITCVISCTDANKGKGDPIDYLPQHLHTVLKVTNPSQLKSDIEANALASKLDNKLFRFITTSEILNQWKSATPFYLSQGVGSDSSAIVFTKAMDSLHFIPDSIANVRVEKLQIEKLLLQKITLNQDSLFLAEKDSVSIFSTHKEVLIGILNQKKNELDARFAPLNKTGQEGDFLKMDITGVYPVNISEVKNLVSSQHLNILPDGIHISGVVKSTDSSLLDVFKGQIPQESKVAEMLPSDFKSAHGFTFSNASLLISKLKSYKNDSTVTVLHPLLETVTEITEAQLNNGKALLLGSIDIEQSQSSLYLDITEVETVRDVIIYKNNAESSLFIDFFPLLTEENYGHLFFSDTHVVFTSTLAVAKEAISAITNNQVLDKTGYFPLLNEQLLSSSSLFAMGQGTNAAVMTNELLAGNNGIKNTKTYPLAVVQYSYDNIFAHFNFVTKEIANSQQISGTVSQKFSVTIDQPLLGNPQFFTNHRTRGQDIVVQDITNTLHLFSIQGKRLWSKKLDGPILGEINEIDMLRNGKKQFAFATQKTFYVLDRNGKEVAPFPLKFKDDITQPLAVFDYDNNRKYRFVITQGNAILMYNTKGKYVKGFKFKKTETPFVFPPKHIRIGTKDFIVLAEENGKATFLSRIGKERITVKEKFEFGGIPIQKEGSSFVIISADKKKHLINTSGGTTTQNLAITDSYYFKILGNTKVTLDDNLLRINEVLVELPFGMYSEPQLINRRNNTFISVTDLQEHKVYVFDKNRNLLEGFPVYGTSIAQLSFSANKLVLVTTGSEKEILCYQVN